jgi:GntR family transcriptional regulator, transcriptional repressor for pyruvate dehydrogenase complex
MTDLLKPIRIKRISDQVFEQIRDLLFRGQLKTGERLMPERKLAQALGVSRPTVREAINKLVTMGFLEHRQGQGTFVRSLDSQRENNPLSAIIQGSEVSLEDLLEVRMGLEGQAAILAAQRATPEDIRILASALSAMLSQNQAGELGIEEDVSFHMGIAYATKNTAQVYLMRSFYDLLHFGIKENLTHLWEDPANLPVIQQQHTAIFEAIKRHDPEAAYEAMRRHIAFVLDYVRTRKPKVGVASAL